jgi:hypothetical protein
MLGWIVRTLAGTVLIALAPACSGGPGESHNVKPFKISASEIKRIAVGLGSCIASDLITVGGHPVGFFYREQPSDSLDSGWRFMAGTESEAFMANPSNFEIYDLNTVANYDPAVVPHLGSPIGSAFERSDSNTFVLVPFEPPSD